MVLRISLRVFGINNSCISNDGFVVINSKLLIRLRWKPNEVLTDKTEQRLESHYSEIIIKTKTPPLLEGFSWLVK